MRSHSIPRASAALLSLAFLGSCWTTGGSEPAVDPKEAQPREVVQKTEAELERDDRFQDRRRRRVKLDDPVTSPAETTPPK